MTPVRFNILFDRDGTLIADKHYLSNPYQVELLPYVGESLGRLVKRDKARLYVVSNQSGIGRGMFPDSAATACNRKLAEILAEFGVGFQEMLYCPHAPEAGCACRKPAPGMWQTLENNHCLEAASAIMVGDKVEDMLFARNAGLAGGVLVLTGKGIASAEQLGVELPSGFEGLLVCEAACLHGRPPVIIISDFSYIERAAPMLLKQEANR